MTILVADDDAVIRELIKTALEQEAYRVVTASDGLEAVRLAWEYYPGVAILDVMMPGLDGYEIARRIRGHRALGKIPVLFATALARPADIDEAYASGGDDHIAKPFTPAELRARLRAVLRRNGDSPGFAA